MSQHNTHLKSCHKHKQRYESDLINEVLFGGKGSSPWHDSTSVMLAQSIPILYHKEGLVKTEMMSIVDEGVLVKEISAHFQNVT